MNCNVASVSCSNTAPLNLTFGYLDPSQVSGTGIHQTLGVIILHNGDGGTQPGSFAFADSYFRAGYEVVQVAWSDDWEITQDPFSTISANIQNAACRPATFFNYVYTSLFPSVYNANNKAGICAQGTSAGSAATAYSLAYYGAGSYFDNVELLSGPVLSDVRLGCEVPLPAQVNVCGQTNYNGGQYGCQLGTGGSTWSVSPAYVGGAQTGVQKWTNDQTCSNGTTTSAQSDAAWLTQSIVDQSSGGAGQGAVPTFTYSYTGMSAWLCRSVLNSTPPYPCAANGNNNPYYCPNNSSSQGQLFYANIGSGNSPANYAVYAVDNCQPDSEAVGGGTVPGFFPNVFTKPPTGSEAITDDMLGLAPTIPPQCVHRAHPQ